MERVHVLSTPLPKELSRPTEGEVQGEVTRTSWLGVKSGLHCTTTIPSFMC